jgi:hypothetical protein
VSQSFGYIPKSGIAGSNGRSMSSFLSSLQVFLQSGCTRKTGISISIYSFALILGIGTALILQSAEKERFLNFHSYLVFVIFFSFHVTISNKTVQR